MKTQSGKKAILIGLLFSVVVPSTFAGSWNTNKQNVVLDGFDVVAYQNEAKARKGAAKHSARYDNVTFYFSSQQNLELFQKNPAKYLPKYNGFCAFAVGAKNARVPANPDTFKLYNGNLLVFFNDVHDGQKFNTKIPWNANEKELFHSAENNWKSLKKQ